jgi:hypothetical protein
VAPYGGSRVIIPNHTPEEGGNLDMDMDIDMEPTPEFEQVTKELPEYALLIDIPDE